MYALSLGVQNMGETLPKPVYALLSGLNASTVGIIALAAVQLAEKAIRDKLSRILVIFGACAGLCYSALWYFPVLMVIGGLLTSIWDGWLYQEILRARIAWKNRHNRSQDLDVANGDPTGMDCINLEENTVQRSETTRSRRTDPRLEGLLQSTVNTTRPTQSAEDPSQHHIIRIRVGVLVMGLFFSMHPVHLINLLRVKPNVTSFLHWGSCCEKPAHHTSTGPRPLCQYVPCWYCHLWWRSRRHSPFTYLRC